MARNDDLLGDFSLSQDNDMLVNSAVSLAEIKRGLSDAAKALEQENKRKIAEQNAPLLEQMQKIVDKAEEQNRLLTAQNDTLKAEIEHKKEHIAKAEAETKRANKRFWLTFGITTTISVVALAVAIWQAVV